jgi:NAD(P)H-quinone oxidoreductase subunit K
MDALIKLRKKIAQDSIQERGVMSQTHRYYTRAHQMKLVPPIHDGNYLESPTRQAPPQELAATMGLPVAPALQVTSLQEN